MSYAKRKHDEISDTEGSCSGSDSGCNETEAQFERSHATKRAASKSIDVDSAEATEEGELPIASKTRSKRARKFGDRTTGRTIATRGMNGRTSGSRHYGQQAAADANEEISDDKSESIAKKQRANAPSLEADQENAVSDDEAEAAEVSDDAVAREEELAELEGQAEDADSSAETLGSQDTDTEGEKDEDDGDDREESDEEDEVDDDDSAGETLETEESFSEEGDDEEDSFVVRDKESRNGHKDYKPPRSRRRGRR